VFVSSSGDKFSKNSGAFRFGLEEGFYVAGFLAASMSKSGKLGMVGGPNVPSIESTFEAFAAGAKAAKPTVDVKKIYTNENADIAKAKQATLELIGQGCDFLIHQANAGASGFFDACKEKGVYSFGSNANQNDQESAIASAIIVAKPAFITLAKEVQEGKYTGAVRQFSMKDGAIDFVINPKLADKVPVDLTKKIDTLKEDIKSGKVQVPMKKF
jgi:basic membrane lipoprotein Med (substrate-binding protein (PBP1-ABC) superfamily)